MIVGLVRGGGEQGVDDRTCGGFLFRGAERAGGSPGPGHGKVGGSSCPRGAGHARGDGVHGCRGSWGRIALLCSC